ncbi:lipoyltransferase, partial [Mycoplasmopsis synoviae]
LANVLTPSKIKFESKGIKYVAKRVTNIVKELNYSITVQDFIDDLIKFFVTNYDAQYSDLPVLRYKNKVQKIIERNSSRDWIYGKNAEFSVNSTNKFNG